MLGLAAKGQESAASSNLQLSETLSVALMTGPGTAVTAYGSAHGWATPTSLAVVFGLTSLAALLGIGAGLRTRGRGRGARQAPDPHPTAPVTDPVRPTRGTTG